MNAVQLLNATLPAWVTDSFPIIRTVIIVVMVVLSLALTLIVLVQPSNPQGMNAISGQSDTYYSKNKSRTMEGVMRRLTVIISIVLGVGACVLHHLGDLLGRSGIIVTIKQRTAQKKRRFLLNADDREKRSAYGKRKK